MQIKWLVSISVIATVTGFGQSERSSLQVFFQQLEQSRQSDPEPPIEETVALVHSVAEAAPSDVKAVMPSLVRCLRHRVPLVRTRAAFILSYIGRRADSATLLTPYIISLAESLTVDDARVSTFIAQTFGELRSEPPEPAKRALMDFVESPRGAAGAKSEAVAVLMQMAPPTTEFYSAVRVLVTRFTYSDDIEDRIALLNVFGRFPGDVTLQGFIVSALSDRNPAVAEAAVNALTMKGSQPVVVAEKVLIQMLEDKHLPASLHGAVLNALQMIRR